MEEVKNEAVVDDDLYAKIETEKLVKEKKRKKITTIVFLSVVFVLAVVIICLASIPLNLKPSYFKTGDYQANVFINGHSVTGAMSPSDDESNVDYNELVGVFNSAFQQTYFSALFNGSLSGVTLRENKVTYDKFYSDNLSGGSYVRFEFNEAKTLLNASGNVYQSTQNRQAEPFTFDEAYLLISEEDGVQDASFYVVVRYLNSDGKELTNFTGEYVIQIETKANTSVIFEHYNPEN